MATAIQKITLSASRDIPFNKLVLSQSNVRRVKAGVSIEELADDIARRTLLQSLSVRPILDAEGAEPDRWPSDECRRWFSQKGRRRGDTLYRAISRRSRRGSG